MKYLLTLLMILPLNAFAVAVLKVENGNKSYDAAPHKMKVTEFGLNLYFTDDAGVEKECGLHYKLGDATFWMKELSSDKKYEIQCQANSYGYYYGLSVTTGM
jgi:hypothetical protein